MPVITDGVAYKEADSLVVASGIITVTSTLNVITAESGGPTDTIDTITNNFPDQTVSGNDYKAVIILTAAVGDVITLAHGTGNLIFPEGLDIVMNETTLVALQEEGTDWKVVGGGRLANKVVLDSDPGGIASKVVLTNDVADTPTVDPGWVTSSSVNMNAPDGYLKMYNGAQTITVPFWNT